MLIYNTQISFKSHKPELTIASETLKCSVENGFKWDNEEQLWQKLDSEIKEFKASRTPTEKEDEFGDILHSLVSIANYHGVDPQKAMSRANNKFISRYNTTEELVKNDGKKMKDLNLQQILAYWKAAKKITSENPSTTI